MSIPTLAECIYRICKRDLFLRRINFTNECFESFWDYEHDRERQYDSVSSGDTTDLETTNKQKLRRGDAGEMEWYEDLGQMIGQLDGLYSLHFDSLDIDREELRRFWCEVSRNRCLRFIECTNINITNGEDFLVWFWETKSVDFAFVVVKLEMILVLCLQILRLMTTIRELNSICVIFHIFPPTPT